MAELDNLSLEGFDLGAALGISPEAEAAKKTPPPEQGGIKVSHRMGARQLWRKAASEKALEDAMPSWHFREGDCYHCFSFGDVDSFSFFKFQNGFAAAAHKIRRHFNVVHGRGGRYRPTQVARKGPCRQS